MPRTQRLCHRFSLLVCGALLILPSAPALAQAPVVARLVYDLRPGSDDGLPEKICFYCCVGVPIYCEGFFLAAGPEFLWLGVDDGTTGSELWRSDGSPAGTYQLAHGHPGGTSGQPRFERIGDLLYYVTDDPVYGYELWRSNGTPEGSHLLLDLMPGRDDAPPWRITELNGLVLFSGVSPGSGRELWATDGTAAGTRLVYDIRTGPKDSDPGSKIEYNGSVYFAATDAEHGRELWVTDGTTAGTRMVSDLQPGESDTNPGYQAVSNGILFFSGSFNPIPYVPNRGALCRTDGTSEGTHAIRIFRPSESVTSLTDLGGTLFFVTNSSEPDLWRSDGTSQGTVNIYDFGRGDFVHSLEVFGDLLFFLVDDSLWRGDILWRSDGTSEGTFPLGETNRWGPPPIPLGDQFLFVKEAAENRGELWITDGTQVTLLLAAFEPGPRDWDMFEFLPVGDEVWFTADDGVHGLELWKTDGTPAGTVLAVDLVPGPGSLEPSHLTLVGDRLFFAGTDAAHGRELWTIGALVSDISIPTLDARGLGALTLVLVALGIVLLRRRSSHAQ